MISPGQISSSVAGAILLLKEIGIYKGSGYKGVGNHSDTSKKVAKSNRHTDIYLTAIQNHDYEILLFDDSIFQFSALQNELRYSFIQNPNIHLSKEAYLETILAPEDLLKLDSSELDSLISSIDENEFEQFLNEQDLNIAANLIRYDFSRVGYVPLIHSCSHIHVGLNPSFRIPCSRVMTPLAFTIFSIKHTYYHFWKDSVNRIPHFNTKILDSKNLCLGLQNADWNDVEKTEFFLS